MTAVGEGSPERGRPSRLPVDVRLRGAEGSSSLAVERTHTSEGVAVKMCPRRTLAPALADAVLEVSRNDPSLVVFGRSPSRIETCVFPFVKDDSTKRGVRRARPQADSSRGHGTGAPMRSFVCRTCRSGSDERCKAERAATSTPLLSHARNIPTYIRRLPGRGLLRFGKARGATAAGSTPSPQRGAARLQWNDSILIRAVLGGRT